MPYTGNLAEFGAIGKVEAAYFDMINARGGINGRMIRFISRDDNSDPTAALDLTRGTGRRGQCPFDVWLLRNTRESCGAALLE